MYFANEIPWWTRGLVGVFLLGRRTFKLTAEGERWYFYDGWNLVEERVFGSDGSMEIVEYAWGCDASGTLDGAGGVGGLLYVRKHGHVYVPVYDPNGSVTGYVDPSTGALVASYAYDGFGRTVAQSGPMADAFSLRYSTKYADPETGLSYYGYRYYSPQLGRWLTRDPLEEEGGINLYGFCGNAPTCFIDDLGGAADDSSDSLCEKAYKFGLEHLSSAEEKRAWNHYTKHKMVNGGGDIQLTAAEVKSIAESFASVRDLIEAKRSECRKGVHFSVNEVRSGSTSFPWERALGGVTIFIKTSCKNGCFEYTYRINDPYDFDIKGVPFVSGRPIGWNEIITIGVNLTGACLSCGWEEFNHRGEYTSR